VNVKELREILERFEDTSIVRFSYDYGDHNHHMIAHEIEYVDFGPVKESAYVDDYVVDDNESGEFIEDENYSVILS
jgi:hypothetical protein